MSVDLRAATQIQTEGEVAVLPSQRTKREEKHRGVHSSEVEVQNIKGIILQQTFVHKAVEQQHKVTNIIGSVGEQTATRTFDATRPEYVKLLGVHSFFFGLVQTGVLLAAFLLDEEILYTQRHFQFSDVYIRPHHSFHAF